MASIHPHSVFNNSFPKIPDPQDINRPCPISPLQCSTSIPIITVQTPQQIRLDTSHLVNQSFVLAIITNISVFIPSQPIVSQNPIPKHQEISTHPRSLNLPSK